MTPLDLTKGRPRTPQDQLDDLAFFPRTIDKARASLPGGNKGDYNVAPGISDQFLKHFGLPRADRGSPSDSVAQSQPRPRGRRARSRRSRVLGRIARGNARLTSGSAGVRHLFVRLPV